MEFDPLENILSDSSNDSFFGGQTMVARRSTPSLAEPSAGRKSDSRIKPKFLMSLSKEKAVDSDILTGSSHKTSPNKIASTSIKKVHGSLLIANESELINDLGFDPKKPKTGKVDISNLFGELEVEKISRQSTETTESFTPGTYTKLRQKTNKQFTSSLDDPLGFFTSNKEKQEPNSQCKDNKDMQKLPVKPVDVGIFLSAPDKQDKEASFGIINVTGDVANHDPVSFSKAAKSLPFESGSIELQNSLHALRLEEARLLVAAQMKMQQQLLLEMKKKQDAVFLHQETQFNNMLKEQALHKNELENTIRMQEERIRLQVQTWFAAPTTVDNSFRNNLENVIIPNVGMVNFYDELNKLKEENQRLGSLLTSLSDNHRKELELIEQTHKNHIKLLEKNLHKLAVPSKEDEENSELSTRESKFAETEGVQLLESYDKKLKDIEEEHVSSVAKLRKYYDTEIEMLRKDYKWMNENISSQCKCSEAAAKHNNETLQALDVAFVNLKDLAKDMHKVLNEIHSAARKELNQPGEKLITREKQIEDIEQRLQLLDESSQAEHKKLLDLVRSVEALLKNLTEGYAKENVDLLHAERLSLNRERELFLEFIEKKENRIQESQKLHEAEKTVLMRQIQEEWRLLNKERKKLSAKMECDKTFHFDLASNFEDSTDSKVRIDNEKEVGVPISNVLESESCKEPPHWEKIKDEFLKGIQHLRIVELQVHESLQRTELAEKRFNCTIQTLKEQMKHMTVRDARLSKGRFELAQGHLQLRSAASKDNNNTCRYCKTVFGTHSEGFESKLWVDSFFNVHDTADHLKYLDCYIHNSNGSKLL